MTTQKTAYVAFKSTHYFALSPPRDFCTFPQPIPPRLLPRFCNTYRTREPRRYIVGCVPTPPLPLHTRPKQVSTSPHSLGINKSCARTLQQVSKLNPSTIGIFPPRANQSSISGWTTIVFVITVLAGGYVYKHSLDDTRHINEQQSGSNTVDDSLSKLEDRDRRLNKNNMTGEALPGRPGTLTEHQEEKLREFWVATLQVFGVLDSQQVKDLNGNGAVNIGNGTAKSQASDKKPKKKRLSLFRSKNQDDDAESTAKTGSGPIDSDDKYGQTKQFQEAIANESPESLRAAFWSMVKHDHPDALLLRFLRARKWDVEKALVMMVSTMRWRASEMHVDDDIMINGEMSFAEAANGDDPAKKKLGEDFLQQMRLGKSFLHGVDKEGRPMCFVRVRLHKCVIFDMTGFSMANMDYTPVKFMVRCFESNYPESLGVVLVHNAPWIFQGIWKIIRGWLDPVVASKIQFTSNLQEMEEFVPRDHIPKELGGDEDWSYKYIEPVAGENDIMKDTEARDKLAMERENIIKDYEKEILHWINAGETNASGTKIKRQELANTLRENYWRIDPYLRARSYYDRVGTINPGGRLQFYPLKSEEKPASGEVATSADDID
ncbi:hypothetical protein B7494_g7065 [Chlorociboria aeruginascens]|nr:hypothetical protein B7494_g7065 [Chlorociboria aeruginascens]